MLVSVRVIPRSSKNKLEWDGEGFKAHLTAPPVDGAANEALVALLADQLSLPRRTIRIVRGATSRQKVVEIENLTPEIMELRFPHV
jgi:uncharacterized protein (TIGR00251 family)